ncbi:MAG: hypothetical protein WC489_03825 [Patescibacteria group bacterium]
MKQYIHTKGQSIIELLVVFSLSAILLPVLLASLTFSREGKAQQIRRQDATFKLKEIQEAVKHIKDRDWKTFAVDGIYHPEIQSNKWMLVAGEFTDDNFEIAVDIQSVYRDELGMIVQSGGQTDPSTKKVTVSVSWETPQASSVSNTHYYTRFRENVALTHTTLDDFTSGTPSGTAIVETTGSLIPEDAEIILGSGGRGNWCSPDLLSVSVDLPKSGVANDISAIEGKISAVTGDNASGISYANVLLSNDNPPVSVIEGTFDGYKTNGVFVDGHYAYLATDTNDGEFIILDLEQLNPITKKYTNVGYFDAPGNTDGNKIFVSGLIGYALVSNQLYTFDLTAKTGLRTQLGVVSLAGTGTEVYVLDNYAYVSISGSSTNEMQIIQVSNGGATLGVVGKADVNGQAGKDIVVNSSGTRAYIATGVSSTQREFFIIDITSKTGTRPVLGSYETNGMDPKGVALATGNRAIIVGLNAGGDAEEYQVINIAEESNPIRCGGKQVNEGINGISALLEADGDAYSYIITRASSAELRIIEGGPGGQYSTGGTYISPIIDAGYTTMFNRFTASVSQPVQTEVKIQIAVADPLDGNCSTAQYTYIGPDTTNPETSYFTPVATTISGTVPTKQYQTFSNPGRCFRYKVYMTTSDVTSTPLLTDFTINYAP